MKQRTHPLVSSPPLSDGGSTIDWPTPRELAEEIQRASAELMWALHRQRTAWKRLVKLKAEYGERNIDFIDNERAYRLAIGDVSWWRGEVSSRANALQALMALLNAYGLKLPDPWT